MPNLVNETKYTAGLWGSTHTYVLKDGHKGSDPPKSGQVLAQERVVRNRTSQVTPQFKLLMRLGRYIAPNEFTFTRIYNSGSVVLDPLILVKDYGGYTYTHTFTGVASNFTIPDATFHDTGVLSSKLRGKLINKTLLKVKSEKVNVGNAIAERKQTLDLIADTATRLFKALRSVKKGDMLSAAAFLSVNPTKRMRRRGPGVKSGVRTRDEMSGRWLELQYGWLPLLSDVAGAIDELYRGDYNVVRNRATSRDIITDRKDSGVTTTEYIDRSSYEASSEITVSLDYLVTYPQSKSLAQLGLTNPAAIAWELTPWSFVIDWFLPIGNYIATFDATLGTTFIGGRITTFNKSTVKTLRVFRQWPFEGVMHQAQNGTGRKTQESLSVRREKLLTYPSATLPDFKNPLSPTHALNAIALLSTVFKSKVPR